MTTTKNARRQMQGTVTSTAMEKTITVQVSRTYRHPKYGKYVRRQKKYLAHDEEGSARRGDVVQIESTRPLSKRKRWRLVRVLERSEHGEDSPELNELEGGDEVAAEGGEA